MLTRRDWVLVGLVATIAYLVVAAVDRAHQGEDPTGEDF